MKARLGELGREVAAVVPEGVGEVDALLATNGIISQVNITMRIRWSAEVLRAAGITRAQSNVTHQQVWLQAFELWMQHAAI